jgi:hypothetical protein
VATDLGASGWRRRPLPCVSGIRRTGGDEPTVRATPLLPRRPSRLKLAETEGHRQ